MTLIAPKLDDWRGGNPHSEDANMKNQAFQSWAYRDWKAAWIMGAPFLVYIGFWLGQLIVNQREIDRAIEAAQYQIAVIRHEEQSFRDSLMCAADTIIAGCWRWERKP